MVVLSLAVVFAAGLGCVSAQDEPMGGQWPYAGDDLKLGCGSVDTCPSDAVDLLQVYALIDFSGSIGTGGWNAIRNFLFGVGPDEENVKLLGKLYCARYGLSESYTNLYVNIWSSKEGDRVGSGGGNYGPGDKLLFDDSVGSKFWKNVQSAKDEVDGIDPSCNSDSGPLLNSGDPNFDIGCGTNPTSVLPTVRDLARAKAEEGFRQVVVFLTDGVFGAAGHNEVSRDKLDADSIAFAEEIKEIEGATLITVGVGNGVETDVLTSMASPDLYLAVNDFNRLDDALDTILEALKCPPGETETRDPPSAPPASPTTARPTSPTTSPTSPTSKPSSAPVVLELPPANAGNNNGVCDAEERERSRECVDGLEPAFYDIDTAAYCNKLRLEFACYPLECCEEDEVSTQLMGYKQALEVQNIDCGQLQCGSLARAGTINGGDPSNDQASLDKVTSLAAHGVAYPAVAVVLALVVSVAQIA